MFVSGCSSRPKQTPAFMAALSANLDHCTGQQPVIFDAVKVNQGGLYDPVHGIFRTNVTGMYVFTATLSVSPHNSFHVAFVKNKADNVIGYIYTDIGNIWLKDSSTVLVHLDAGDEVWMVCLSESRIEDDYNHGIDGAQDYHSHIAGFLLSAD